MRQQIQQSKNAIAELVAKLQEEQAKLERMEARAEKYEEAIAFLQEAIAEDPMLWGEVRDRLQPTGNSEEPKDEFLRAAAAPSHAIAEDIGTVEESLLKILLEERWLAIDQVCDRLYDEFSDCLPDVKASLVILERENLIVVDDSEYSIHPNGIKWLGDRQLDRDRSPASEQIFDAECLPEEAIAPQSGDKDLPSLILGHLEAVGSSDFVELCQVTDLEFDDDEIANTLESLKGQGLIFEISEEPWLWSVKAPAAAVESTEPTSNSAPPQPEIAIRNDSAERHTAEPLDNFGRLSVTVDEVLDGASPLNLSAAQMSDLEDVLVREAPPSIDDGIAEEKPSAYAEEMALKIKVGMKLKSLPSPGDPKHKYSKKRTGIVRRIERIGANIYAFVAELSEAGNNSRQTAYYNVEAVEIIEEAPAIELAISEPFDPIEVALQSGDALRGIEAEILQFLTEKAAQADLYEGNDPTASLSEIGDAIKLDSPDDWLHTALDNLEAQGSILHRDIYGVGDRWQIAPEKPSQDHSFKVGDRVIICGDSKGEDLIGKSGTLTAVSLTGCVLYLDGEDENNRLFFCKEDLSPCSTFSQAV